MERIREMDRLREMERLRETKRDKERANEKTEGDRVKRMREVEEEGKNKRGRERELSHSLSHFLFCHPQVYFSLAVCLFVCVSFWLSL